MKSEKYIGGAAVGGAILFTILWLRRARAAPPPKWNAEIGAPTFSEV